MERPAARQLLPPGAKLPALDVRPGSSKEQRQQPKEAQRQRKRSTVRGGAVVAPALEQPARWCPRDLLAARPSRLHRSQSLPGATRQPVPPLPAKCVRSLTAPDVALSRTPTPLSEHTPQRRPRRKDLIDDGVVPTPSTSCDSTYSSVGSPLSVDSVSFKCNLMPSTVAAPAESLPTTMSEQSVGSVDVKSSLPRPAIASWRRGNQIGQGSFGSVYRAQDMQTGFIFAVKQTSLEGDHDKSERQVKRLMLEVDICMSLKHPNIVSYLGHEIVEGNLCIFMEYVEGGSIASILREFGALSRVVLQKATRGALEGLDYLHTRNPPVVHRDIKGANLLVDAAFNVKITDFGCSKQADATKSLTAVGSIPWMAPEVILQQDGHGRKADMWSLGCTVLEMATAEAPWGAGAFDNMMCALRHIGMTNALPPIPASLPELCRDFVQVCVQRAAERRPTTTEALDHKFLAA